jgi:hypothetical protein
VKKFSDVLGDELVTALLTADQKSEKGIWSSSANAWRS